MKSIQSDPLILDAKALKNYLSALPDNLGTDDSGVVASEVENSSADEKYREIKQALSQDQEKFKTADDINHFIISMI